MPNIRLKQCVFEAIQKLPEDSSWNEILDAVHFAAAKTLPPEVLRRATEVIGNESNAMRWLAYSNSAIGDLAPVEVIGKEGGMEEVLNLLGRIEQGCFS